MNVIRRWQASGSSWPGPLSICSAPAPVAHTGTLSRVRDTQRKGDIATTHAIATFTAQGFDVSIPVTESAAYDLVVDDHVALHRVQCKFSSNRHVDLRRIHSNSSGYVVKAAAENAYDWLYVLRPDGSEYLLKKCLAGRRAVTVRAEHLIGAGAESG
jgi:hypothetical protein